MGLALPAKTIRDDFPALRTTVYGRPLVYLDNAATTHKPRCVIDRLASFYISENSNIHRGVHFLSEQASAGYESAREKVQTFINAKYAHEIVFTQGTTAGVNLAAQSFGDAFVGEGDEVVVTEMEHHSNLIPWQQLCRRTGAVLKMLPFDDGGRLRVELLDKMLSHKTKLFACGVVSNALGVIHPVKEMIALAHANDTPVFVDGAQAVQHMPIDVQELDCDFFAFSGHKMYAATGVGVLYGKEKWLERMPPCHFGGGMVRSVNSVNATFAEPPYKFEAGTPAIGAALSLEAAITYLQTRGLENIARYEKELLDYALARLSGLKNSTIYAAQMPRAGVISCNLAGICAYDIGAVLDKLGVAVRTGAHCAEPVMNHFGIRGTLRASIALYTTFEDIDAFFEGMQRAQDMLG